MTIPSPTPSPDLRHRQTAFSRYRPLIDDWDAFCSALGRSLPPVIRTNTLRLDPNALRTLLAEEGVRARPLAWLPEALRLEEGFRPGRHWGQMAGLYQVQEEVSLLPVALLDPRPGERVLDLCAAPGNKTAHLALALQGTGTVVANDLNRGRLAPLRLTVKRLGLVNVTVTRQPGQHFPRAAGPFDRVLVDGPCSCEGTYRKSPSAARVLSDQDRQVLVKRQVQLLTRGVELTRPGGRIVYSTCTFAPEENEGVVDTVLERFGDELRLLPARLAGFDGEPGLTDWQGRHYRPELVNALRAWPHHQDSGGFFVALLERVPGPVAPIRGLELADADPVWLEVFYQRFGLEPTDLTGLRAVSYGQKYLHFVPFDHRPPGGVALESCGLPTVRLQTRPPRLTTAAALALGGRARHNVLTLNEDQLTAYLTRQAIVADGEQLRHCTGPGPVVVCHRGLVVGLGQLQGREGPGARVESLFPKAWIQGGQGDG